MSFHLTPESKNEDLTPTPNLLQNVTYKTRCNIFAFVFFFAGFIFICLIIIGGIYMYLYQKEKNFLLLIYIFIISLIATFVGGCQHFYYSLNINTYLGIIKVKTIKLYCCFNKTKTIIINEIQKVLIQKDNSVRYEINGRDVDAIEVVFVLHNESEIKGCSGLINSNNECYKIYNFLSNSLPQNIPIEGNLVNV